MIIAAAGLAVVSFTLAGCNDSDTKDAQKSLSSAASDVKSSASLSDDDAYAVGCPIVDSAAGAGSIARRAAAATLTALRNSDTLSADQKSWVSDAADLLKDKPDDAPSSLRSKVVDGCAEHGHKLSNLDKN